MKILIVSPWLPHAESLHAGGQSLYQTIRWLANRHEVHLLCYGRSETPEQIKSTAGMCASIKILYPAHTWPEKFTHFQQGGWRRPWRLGRQTHLEAQAHIHQQKVDVVHFAWTEMGRYLDAVPAGVATVLATQDVEARVRPRELDLYPPGRAKRQAAQRAQTLIDIEKRSVPHADVTLACSAHDQDYFLRWLDKERIFVVPPWMDIENAQKITAEMALPGRLVFIGAMDRIANVAAAQWLIERVWPHIRAQCPHAHLRIVGANPPGSLLHRGELDSRLTITGKVPTITDEWAYADVAVCPSLIGGGLLVKVAGAMAAGRPVVTTTYGSEGVGVCPGLKLEVHDDPAQFAETVINLLSDRDRWHQIAAAEREHALKSFDWHTAMTRLEQAYQVAKSHAKNRAGVML